MERVMGIEPTLAAWEAAVLPLNYTRISGEFIRAREGWANPSSPAALPELRLVAAAARPAEALPATRGPRRYAGAAADWFRDWQTLARRCAGGSQAPALYNEGVPHQDRRRP